MSGRIKPKLSRRRLLQVTAALAALEVFPAPAIAQPVKVKMTLPWLPQGAQLYPFIARNKGFWKGLDVEIARGFGSGAAQQAVAQGQFDIGIVAVTAVILAAAKGVDSRAFGIHGYDSTIGLCVLDDGPIKSLKDLEGRKLGQTTTGGEAAYIDPFLRRSGVDTAKITRVQLAANLLESALINKQVDAFSSFGTSQIPNLVAQGIKFRFFPYSAAGMTFYNNCLMASPAYFAANTSVCEAFSDGINEAIKYCMLNLPDAVEVFLREVPEVRMASTGRDFTRIGAGLFIATQVVPEVMQNGIGWADMAAINKQIDMVKEYVVGAEGTRPAAEPLFSNRFSGKLKFTTSEAEAVRSTARDYAAWLSIKI